MSAILKLNHPSESLIPSEVLQNHLSKLRALADIVVDLIYRGETLEQMTPENVALVEACQEVYNYLYVVISSHVSPEIADKFQLIYLDLFKDYIRNAMEQSQRNPKYSNFVR
jgi:hypothetical protein